jgi:short-subunit dehydrogenase
MDLREQVAIVTGASSGIGLAVARMLISGGARVVLVARGAERLEKVAAELGALAVAWPLDVGDLEAVARLPAEVHARFGRLDIVINNAGLHHRGDMLRHDPLQLAEMVKVNLSAPIVLTRAAAELMPAGSVVVNVASLAGKLGVPGSAVYSGTKAGLRFWGLAAAEDLGKRGIRIANVNPGPVDTGFFDADFEHVTDLTFSQPMCSAEQVAAIVMDCVRSRETGLDRDIPYMSGKLSTIAYLSPGLARLLRPALERKGAANKRKFLVRKGGA